MACPAPETFSAFVSGSLADADRDALEVHVDTCASCRVTLSELARGSQTRMPRAVASDRVGRYELAGELGAGAMGVVYRARDPELDREVAIKLVRPQAGAPEDELVEQRMLREGRALARIDHANVVRVFDVGHWDGGLFVAMERAPGASLRVWLEAPRTPAQIVGVLAQCARGLAAAHAAGVIHRDFKPDNVIVDERGHARVTDFGLAQTDTDEVRTLPDDEPPRDVRLTRTRGVVGTPAYMAPEQHRGEPIDARADQFAWAVTLAEALGGDRPFAAPTLDALKAPPRLPAAPRRVRRVLERALAFDPAQRFASMTDAADALRPRRVWPWLAAAVVVAGLGTAYALRGDRDSCAGVDAYANEIVARADRVTASGRVWEYTRGVIDDHVARWRATRIGACRSGAERPRVVHCLQRRFLDIEAALMRWEQTGVDGSAPQIADRFVPPEQCETTDEAAPTDAERFRLRGFEARYAAAQVLADAGQPLEAQPALVALERELATTPHQALRAEVLTRLGGVSRDLGKRDEAHAHLVAALAAAETARVDRVRVKAWIALAANAADDFSKIADARDALRLASAVLAHLGSPEDLVSLHDATTGLVELRANNTKEAIAAMRRSLAAKLSPTEHALRIQMLARALIVSGEIPGALAELERAEQMLIAALGPEAPQLVFVLNSMIEPLDYLDRVEDAIAKGERALVLLEKHYGKTNPRRSQTLGNLAQMYARAGDNAKARTLQEEVLAASARDFGPDAQQTATARHNLASTLQDLGEHALAIEHLERARAIFAKVLGPDAPLIANVETSLYDTYTALGRHAEALAHAERALAIREATETAPGYLAYTRIIVADALFVTGANDRAIAMAKRAAELPLASTGREGELKQKIGEWLAQHAKR